MVVRIANKNDIKDIVENNINLADESENVELSYETVVKGVQSIIEDKNKGFYLVMEKEGQIIGQLMVTYEWSDWRNMNMWWIQSVYVRKNHRGTGIMNALFDEIVNRAIDNDVEVLRLYVYTKNTIAINAYEKKGMEKKPYYFYQLNLL
jgi:GNAT superfamily N-acetyltransferase